MKRAVISALLIVASMMLYACGNNSKVKTNLSDETVSIQTTQMDDDSKISNPIIGEWIAQGIIYEGNVISFEENDTLADLYDTEWIYINDDYSFSKQSGAFTGKGVWEQVEIDGVEYAYRFHQSSSSRLSIDKKGNYEEIVQESDREYIAILSSDNLNALVFSESSESDDNIILVYIREGEEILSEENDLKSSDQIEVGKSKTKCVYDGCDNEIASSGDTNCCIIHSNNCLECEKYIDGDAMYCMDCLSGAINHNTSSNNSAISRGQQNALERAYEYLNYMSFSYVGLIEQLEFEGFTNSEATYAVDNCGADWYYQAVLKAEEYLEYSSFSRSGLIEQLEFEGFTSDQANYAVEQVY